MSKDLINKHNFEKEIREIERFSRNVPSDLAFKRVEIDGGLFGWGDHKVTGTEMNQFIGVVQDKLISVNTSLMSIIGEFKQVYTALKFLDEEYINGIIGSAERAEEASEQALKAQGDIKETVENLKGTVDGLLNLKMKVEHLEKVNQSIERINNDITALQQYCSVLESYKHLGDVDAMWGDIEGHKMTLDNLHQQVNDFVSGVHAVETEIKESIQRMEESNADSHLRYEKKIKIVYSIGGTAVGLSIIQFILQVMGVL